MADQVGLSGTAEGLIPLPKGGGAQRGLGESFTADPHTGTGNLTVGIAVSPGRHGLTPPLQLSYSTGTANGPFGLGWDIGLPSVARKTSQGVPRYRDRATAFAEQDVFILPGVEDLVPVRVGDGVVHYRPRTEAAFSRIIRRRGRGDDFWEATTRGGVTNRFGTPRRAGDDPTTVAFPDDGRGADVFSWRLESTRDTFGNQIVYEYQRDRAVVGGRRFDQLYPARVRYVDHGPHDAPSFLYSVTFDYVRRPDPFSDYRAGFEIRTRLRCRAIHVWRHDDGDRRIRTYQLTYLDERTDLPDRESLMPANGCSLLSQVQLIGYDDDGVAYDGTVHGGRSRPHQFPPMQLRYTTFEPRRRRFDPIAEPVGQPFAVSRPSGPTVTLADLTGDGLPDLVQLDGTARYWRNRGNGSFDDARALADVPAGVALSGPGSTLLDADGDGRVELIATQGNLAGYFPLRVEDAADQPRFRRYAHAPTFALTDPGVCLIDLDGDGVVDAIRTSEDSDRWQLFYNDARRGWDPTRMRQVARGPGDDLPVVDFASPQVRCADMSGDGLTDIVTVFDGNVEYWPNLGHGNWAPRVHMRRSPRLPDGWDPARLLLGDVDGDGLADLVYVDHHQILLWINMSGEAWSEPIAIGGMPGPAYDSVSMEDLYGTGARGLLWSSVTMPSPRACVYFLDFVGRTRPYLLTEVDGRMGGSTRITYGSSVDCMLADRSDAELRWRTTLPFPVPVVRRVVAQDAISGGTLVTEFDYHHGYWDGAEREFRGFGIVDRRDTEMVDRPAADFVPTPPTLTRTWYHIGPVGPEFGDWQERWAPGTLPAQWAGDLVGLERPARYGQLLGGLPRRAARDAVRATRGTVRRTELYALDGGDRQDRPYEVSESVVAVAEVVDRPDGAHELRYTANENGAPPDFDAPPRVFFPYVAATRTTRWERGDDPRTQLTYIDDHDPFGQPRRQTTICPPRGWLGPDDTPSAPYLAVRSRRMYATSTVPGTYLVDRVATDGTWEVTGTAGLTVDTIRDLADDDPRLRVWSHQVSYYDGSAGADGSVDGLPVGQVGRHGVQVWAESLVLTDAVLTEAYGPDRPPYLAADLPAWVAEYPTEFRATVASWPGRVGYAYRADADHPAGWYAPDPRVRYDFHNDPAGAGRGLALTKVDALGGRCRMGYDSFALLPVEIRRLGNAAGHELVIRAGHNYRVGQPRQVVDENGNVTEFAFTPAGLPAAMWLRGKNDPARPEGDLVEPSVRWTYDLTAFHTAGQPIWVGTTRRVHHDSATVTVPAPARDDVLAMREYSDGFGRLVQTRSQADPRRFGDGRRGGGDGVLPVDQDDPGRDVTGKVVGADAVVVSGWHIYDNKGQVRAQFESTFDTGWQWRRPDAAELALGRRTLLDYDPLGRVVRTRHPNGSEHRVVFGVPEDLTRPDQFRPTPWEAYFYDPNDLAPLCLDDDGQPLTAGAAREHHFTPHSVVFDAWGRTVRKVERNGSTAADDSVVVSEYDIGGNVLRVLDPLGRVALSATRDRAGRALRQTTLDGGTQRNVYGATGLLLETRDDRGAMSVCDYDTFGRRRRQWARDRTGESVVLCERLSYGDDPGLGVDADDNVAGRPYRHYDAAGLVTYVRYDFKGALVTKQRRVVGDAAILSTYDQPADATDVPPYRTDWTVLTEADLDAALTLDWTFDALGRVTSMRVPEAVDGKSRRLVGYGYDRSGALESIAVDGTPYVEYIAYNARGERVLVHYGNGLLARYAWDPRSLLLRRVRVQGVQRSGPLAYHPVGNPLQDSGYTFDLAGNLVSLSERAPGSGTGTDPDRLLRTFTYDPRYRLRTATGRVSAGLPPTRPWEDQFGGYDPTATRAYRQAYTYDAADNLLQLRHEAGRDSFTRTYTMVAHGNRLATLTVGTDPPWVCGYDESGNLTAETDSRHFAWDHAGRLRAYRTQTAGAAPTEHATYLYDAAGQRVKKLVRRGAGWRATTVSFDGVFEQQRRVTGARTFANDSVELDASSAAIRIRMGDPFPDDGARDAPVTYAFADHLHSVTLTVGGADAAATIFIGREEFTPYGETSFGGYVHKRYRYAGKERDEESGLNYHGARYFAPWQGRWISGDPQFTPESPNRYTYCGNSPMVLSDRNGRSGGPVLGAVEAGAGVVGEAGVMAEAGAAVETGAALVAPPTPVPPGPLAMLGASVASVVVVLGAFAALVASSIAVQNDFDARTRRRMNAQNLIDDGALAEEDREYYIITGNLERPTRAPTNQRDAHRARCTETGYEFQRHVAETVLKDLIEEGLIDQEVEVATDNTRELPDGGVEIPYEEQVGPDGLPVRESGIRKPDFAKRDPEVPGAYEWIGDAKLGCMPTDQLLDLVDEASRTTSKTLKLFVPEGTEPSIPKRVKEAADKQGVKLEPVPVPGFSSGDYPMVGPNGR